MIIALNRSEHWQGAVDDMKRMGVPLLGEVNHVICGLGCPLARQCSWPPPLAVNVISVANSLTKRGPVDWLFIAQPAFHKQNPCIYSL